MGLLVAGVSASSLVLVYVSIAVSMLAAITLAAGVLLRRREIFGEAAAPADWPAIESAIERARVKGAKAPGRTAEARGSGRVAARRGGEQIPDRAGARGGPAGQGFP